ncbi:MAG: M15 family metallopeptidase [Actinomycetota bacterium]
MRALVAMLAALALAVSACGDDGETADAASTTTTSSTTTSSTTSTTAPTTTTSITTTTSTTTTTTTEPPVPTLDAQISPVTEEDLGLSWRTGCPVPAEDLRRLDMHHWNDDGRVVTGALIVHVDHVDDLISVFDRLFAAEFPIHAMAPVTDFGADDDASMAANNTSAFNCREISGRPGVWSQHSYGGAVDINPLVNPWVRGAQVDPPEGAPYVDRTVEATGIIVAGDVVTQAFADIGWGWGGNWRSSKDYQHFSHNGR